METHEYRIKCQPCGLHYTVYSWDESWAGGPEEGRQGGFCPECGIKGAKIVWTVDSDEFIFQKVPGVLDKVEMVGDQEVALSPPMMITAAMKGGPFGYGQTASEAARGPRGPYGTNEGDIWLAPNSDVQRRLDEEDDGGRVLVHEMIKKDDYVQEVVYTTDNAEMISKAQQGHELWAAAQAAQN